jgi:hypothetical protein
MNNASTVAVPQAFRDVTEPIVGLFVTGGYARRSGMEAARRHVVWIIDGDQVAEDLSRSPAIGDWLNETGTAVDSERFVSFFA